KTQKKKRIPKTRLSVVRKPAAPDVESMDMPSLGDIQAPPGFRVVSYSQAMMEYAGPVLEDSESQDINALNERMQIAMKMWNYGIAGELVTGPRTPKEEIIRDISKVLKINNQQAAEFFKEMIEWKSLLFPEELQQRGVPFMVMRKEVSHIIAPFDLGRINFLEESRQELGWFPETLCNFVYGYLHEDVFVLNSIPPGYLAVFFSDFVLRKVVIKPHMYTYIPASIKLFYTFLWEKEYLVNPVPVMYAIDEIEPHFIEILRKRFG